MSDLEEMGVAELARRCHQETAKSRRRQPADDRYCFELFRRALVQRDQRAWERLLRQYQRLVYSWIGPSEPEAEDMANEVFARFWQQITPDEFGRRFDHLGEILAYLRVCAKNLVINHWRRLEREEKALAYLRDTTDPPRSPERQAVESIAGEELATYVQSRLQGECERLVFYLSFELELKPSEIHERHPHRFDSAHRVSRIKERILERLRRDPLLVRRWGGG